VGGSVRDHIRAGLRGTPAPKSGDWDLATDATPEEVTATFKKVIPTGIKHGTVTVLLDGGSFEVTTLRGERGHSDGRRPDEVFFIDDITLDLARRDFTVNAIAFDLRTGKIVDPYGGLDDLRAGLLRAVGAPIERFNEDGLRVLRAARFAATLEMKIEEETLAAIPETLGSFRLVSAERIRDEVMKALKAREPSRFLLIARETGLLNIIFEGLFESQHPAQFDEAADSLTAQAAILCCGSRCFLRSDSHATVLGQSW
jgi:tRNA nucleotidyltransferase (CCA-adding enzyme)